MNNDLRWFNTSQPQTLQIGVLLLYIDAAFGVLFGAVFSTLGFLLTAAMGAGAFGIANEKKWGYGLGVTGAVAQVVLLFWVAGAGNVLDEPALLLQLIFDGALVGLLLHPMSRDYQRIWFR